MFHDLAPVAKLDESLRVVERDRVIACVSLIQTIYFDDGGSVQVRERVVRTLERFLSQVDPQAFRWGMDPESRAPVRLTGSQTGRPAQLLRQQKSGEPYEVLMHGGNDPDDADPYRVIVAADADRFTHRYLSISLPVAWMTEDGPGKLTQLVVELADLLEPSHGYAGLGATGNVDLAPNHPALAAIVPLVHRFKGLEIDLPTSHCIYLKREKAIKGANWLTILAQPWIERLGGEAALRQALGNGVEWHPYRGGAVIQAGPKPQMGDRVRNEPMTYYEQVSRALKPIRVSSILGIAPDYGFDDRRAQEWLARFD